MNEGPPEKVLWRFHGKRQIVGERRKGCVCSYHHLRREVCGIEIRLERELQKPEELEGTCIGALSSGLSIWRSSTRSGSEQAKV